MNMLTAMKPADAVQILLKAGWSEARIGARIGASQPTVHRMKRGKQPLWDAGSAVIALAQTELLGSANDGDLDDGRVMAAPS